MQESLRHVAHSGSVAEEIISTIRTTHAFGTQATLARIYDTHIDQSMKADKRVALVHGAAIAIFFFTIYSAYALAFSFGTTLINEGHGMPISIAASS